MKRRPLTHNGIDIALHTRAADGRAVFVYLDHHGRPTPHPGRAWPHELRGIGWGIATIKAAIALLPAEGSAAALVQTPHTEPAAVGPGAGRLHAHFSIPEGDR